MAPPAGAGSCRTGRRPRSGACSSTVGDAAPVPGAPRDAHGSAPCAFGETGPMAVGSRAMDRMNRVHPPTCPYGPWTVARWTGTPSSGPVHGPGVVRVAVPAWAFAWTTYLVGPPNGPWSVRVVRDAGPHMGFRVGRMIGPACGPLVHSHDVVRKRAGHADGPHASTWPIRCLCSISCCGFSHDDFSGLGRACRPRNGLNWMVLVSPPERTGKDYDQHAPSTVYPSFAAERGIRRVDRAENTCQRAGGA